MSSQLRTQLAFTTAELVAVCNDIIAADEARILDTVVASDRVTFYYEPGSTGSIGAYTAAQRAILATFSTGKDT